MSFYDRVTIVVQGGRGGDGSASMRREAHVPRGGVDGGDGGSGGNVILVTDPSRRDLAHLRRKLYYNAEHGTAGNRKRSSGKTGEDTIISVPRGTQVFAEDGRKLADMTGASETALVAHGGDGGRGNTHFVSSVRRAPAFAEIGLPGEEITLELRLKLMADAALAGLPNAGKSSLLRRISNARPKVGNYPFTTLQPVLGTIERPDGSQLVVVDVPGLLEGASEGIGMGHEFLAHFERARMLLHTISLEDVGNVASAYKVIQNELWKFDPRIARLPQIIVLAKDDLVDDEAVERATQLVTAAAQESPERHGRVIAIHATSAATGRGLPALMQSLFREADELVRAEDDAISLEPGRHDIVLDEYRVYRPQSRRRRWRIYKDREGFRISGDATLKALAEKAAKSEKAAAELNEFLESTGCIRALRMAGARDGSSVNVFGTSHEIWWTDDLEFAE
ncbi:MAG: GTPase ObgE [Thermoleophilia bacterium]|nr:GTPase ObgE [Thermoleophilia bacterium]